jgi:heme/copper-type cytochrome/quinol oxidase subunit 2
LRGGSVDGDHVEVRVGQEASFVDVVEHVRMAVSQHKNLLSLIFVMLVNVSVVFYKCAIKQKDSQTHHQDTKKIKRNHPINTIGI